jgi:hypothetical protein
MSHKTCQLFRVLRWLNELGALMSLLCVISGSALAVVPFVLNSVAVGIQLHVEHTAKRKNRDIAAQAVNRERLSGC